MESSRDADIAIEEQEAVTAEETEGDLALLKFRNLSQNFEYKELAGFWYNSEAAMCLRCLRKTTIQDYL